jgi:hypothetical protein
MEKRMVWLIVAALVVQLMLVAVVPAAADEGKPADLIPASALEPGNIVLDAEAMHEVIVLGQQMLEYVNLDEEGLLSLDEVGAAALSVDKEYLVTYQEALGYINDAIKQGLFTVDENFQVNWPDTSGEVASVDPETPGLQWRYVPGQNGLYLNFDYNEPQSLFPRYGLSTALSLASRTGRSWYSTPFTYQFSYYPTYYNYYRYSYPYYGGWGYTPYSYLSYYRGYYYPSYRYIYYWYPYGRYYYRSYCYW